MGALEAILGLGALLGVGYYVIQLANKTPISIPFLTPDVSALTVPPLPPPATPPISNPTPPSSSTTTTTKTKKPSNKQQEIQQKPEPDAPILTPTSSEMTSPNVAGTSFTFNVVGDIDYHAGTGENLCGSNPTIALIIGDFSYDCNAQKWWTTTMKTCNGKNVVASVGNHDCGGKGFIDLFPANGGKWSFVKKVGNIAFVALNTGTCSAVCSNPNTEEPFIKQAQADPSVKWIVVHFHKPIFTSGTAPDTPMSFHTMLKKYSKVKMAFAGHNHTYKRYVPQDGIQYITAGQGGHAGNDTPTKGPSSGTIGVVKCRVDANGGISCQYVSNNGTICDSWGLTADGKHTGSGGVAPKQGTGAAESGYVQALYASLDPRDYPDKEDRDNEIIRIMDQRELQMHPRRQFNNQIYHYSKYARQQRRY